MEQSAEQAALEVAAVRRHLHRAPLRHPFVTAARRTEAVEYVVAEVELAGGAVGQGSAAETVAVTGEDAASILAALDGPLGAALRGARGTIRELSDRVAAAMPGATSAKAALEIALHDAWARAAGRPLVELLGGSADTTMRNDMTVSLEEPATMAQRAREAVAAGHEILKIKLGHDIAEDRERLATVVEAAPSARLRLDANQGWLPEQAVEIITGFEADALPVELVEQPVAAGDVEGLARVTAAVSVPIMADEAVWSAADAHRLIEARACDLLNIKLAKTGGLRGAIEVAEAARRAGIDCMLGAMMEPRISITAAAHLALAHPAITMIDLDPPAWFASALPRGGIVQERGVLRLSGGPGLGLELLRPDEDAEGGDR
ncbi:dipeptide epimerase [Brachybacterium paraconglomeratum]|uniref:dipeptide epimerase n=1 Tax=Brachybacterium paraconglomeratum TaxID=173362 RepID=UPI0021A909C8|nr:dipeptide epimerase [Brachybacterium paraconglomeratum]MCT1910790.1 dipeptide epimerase [Brachybacterium paraconglomeratum]